MLIVSEAAETWDVVELSLAVAVTEVLVLVASEVAETWDVVELSLAVAVTEVADT